MVMEEAGGERAFNARGLNLALGELEERPFSLHYEILAHPQRWPHLNALLCRTLHTTSE